MYDKAVMGKINAEKARKYGIFQQVTGIQKVVQSVSHGNKTPLCAREISPGRGIDPPPESPGPEMVWCGERKGRVSMSAVLLGRSPATE